MPHQAGVLSSENGSLKDEEGHIVVSSRNDAINTIAEQSGGKVIAGADADAVREWIERERREDFAGESTITRYSELFYFPLVLGLIAFVLAYTSVGEKVTKTLIPLLALVGISANAGLLDYPYQTLGSYAYSHGNYERSAQWYGRIDSQRGRFNRAASLYKMGKYQEALAIYRTIRSEEPLFKSKVFYNMANCHIRLSEFENARTSLLKSLTLSYTPQADQNLRAIAGAQEQKSLNVRKEKKDQFTSDENKPTGEGKKSKEGADRTCKATLPPPVPEMRGKKRKQIPVSQPRKAKRLLARNSMN